MSTTKRPSSKPTHKSQSVTVLLTGFDAFGGDKHNPSQLVVESFPNTITSKSRRHPKTEITIRKQILPTAGARGWKVLKKALDQTLDHADRPILVLMLGLAASRKTVNLERFALNFRDYALADNDGSQRQNEAIERKTASLLRTNLDLERLQATLSAAGYPCDISNHAGTFICNELYFRALSYKTRFNKKVKTVLFVHLPLENTFAETLASTFRTQSRPTALASSEGVNGGGDTAQIKLLQQAVVNLVESMAAEIAGR